MATVTFQQGTSYQGTIDTTLFQARPSTASGESTTLFVDTGSGVGVQTLMAFTDIFGDAAGQIPIDAVITSATLTLRTTNGSPAGGSLHRMLTGWSEASTWSSLGNGVQLDGIEAVVSADLNTGNVAKGSRLFDVTTSLQAWIAGATTAQEANLANQGWVFVANSTNGWDFSSSESGASAPILTVTYTIPTAQHALAGPVTAAEGTGTGTTAFTFTVNRSGLTSGASSVNYAVTGSGANPASASDFLNGILPSGTITFAAGETSKTITVEVNRDSTAEADETFTVTLSGASGGEITGATAIGTITNDDAFATQLALAGAVTAAEGTGTGTTPFTFTVNRTGDTTGTSSANYAVTGSGANPASASDFAGGVFPNGTVTFAAGETSKTITVGVNRDSTVEPNETFTVTLSGATGAEITGATAVGTIVNDDSAPGTTTTVSFQQGTSYQGTIDTTVWQAQPATSSSESATLFVDTGAGVDVQTLLAFTNLFGTGVGQIPIGSTIVSASLTLNTTNKSAGGGSLHRMLTGWTEQSTWSSLGSGVQLDGTEAVVSADLNTGSVALGSRSFNVTASLQAWLAGATTAEQANLANQGWVFVANSTDGWDFASSESGTVPVLSVTYTPPGGQPPPPQLSLAGPVSAAEGTGSGTTAFTFTVNRSGDTTGTSSANYAVTGSGTNPASANDFAGSAFPSGTVTFAAGETSKTISIAVARDSTIEPNETFTVTLSGASGAQISGATAVGTIVNDDSGTAILGVRTFSTPGFGSVDPTDIAYNPATGALFVCDSEVDESPFFASNNLFRLSGEAQFQQAFSLRSFSSEPTGVVIVPDSVTGALRLFICDDDQLRIYVVDPANPSQLIRSFSTTSFNVGDPEDLSWNPANGNLFVLSENDRSIKEITQTGALVRSIALPSFISTPEGLAYDSANNRFFVVTGASPDIFVISTTGALLETISVLRNHPNPTGGIAAVPKGLELAPSSDGSGRLSLFVTDYGKDQVADGRIIELMLDQPAQQTSALSSTSLESMASFEPQMSFQHDTAQFDYLL